jgi:uncharacterized Zn-binding protein involved in type VI secretion
MKNVACIGDNTAHGGPLTTPGANLGNQGPKIFFNGIPFTTVTTIGTPHAGGHAPVVLIDVVVNATQAKVFINGLPVTIYGAICSCGDIVTGSKINEKIFIQP